MMIKRPHSLILLILTLASNLHATPSSISLPIDTSNTGFCVASNYQCTDGWSFWQHGSGGHVRGGGIGRANDSQAWDINLNSPSHDSDNGKPIYAVESGDIYTGDGWGGKSYGQLLINHSTNGDNWSSGYLHMKNIPKTSGHVNKGDIIGYISNTSPTNLPNHLHFAVYDSHGKAALNSVNISFQNNNTNSAYTQGIDVSHHQSNINWTQVAADPDAEFAYIKATEGYLPAGTAKQTLIDARALDSQFETNTQAALDNQLFVGLYHFARPDLNPGLDGAEQEAKYFARFAAPYYASHAMLPPALDLENPNGIDFKARFDAQTLSAWVQKWLQTVQTELNIKPIIYTFAGYSNYLSGLNDYPLWIARYPVNDGIFHSPDWYDPQYLPNTGNWTNWTLWQYTSQGGNYIDGINSTSLDRSFYTGSLNQLKQWSSSLGGLSSSPSSNPEQLPIPNITSPQAHSTFTANSSIDINWANNSPANTWRILIADSAIFELSTDGKTCYNCIINQKTSSPNYRTSALNSGSYYITIRAGHNSIPASNWSIPSPFYIRLAKTQLLSPADHSNIENPRPLLDWTDIAQSDIARLQIAQSPNFPTTDASEQTCPNCLINEQLSASQYQIDSNLALGTYYWRVRVARIADAPSIPDSGWSTTQQFTIIQTRPPVDNINTPDPVQAIEPNNPPPSTNRCPQSSYAQFNPEQGILDIPFVDLPNINSLTGQPIGTYSILSVQMQVSGNGLKVTQITPLNSQTDPQCHTQVTLPDITVNIPTVMVPSYIELGGQRQQTGNDLFVVSLGYDAATGSFSVEKLDYLVD